MSQQDGKRVSKWYPAPKLTVDFETATYIGLEGLDPNCFDQNFDRGRWRNSKTKIDGDLEYAARMSGQSIDELLKTHKEVLFLKENPSLNCPQLCNSTPRSAACLLLNPSDVQLADKARQNVLDALNAGDIDWGVALSPMIGSTPECKRSESVNINGRLINQGDACAYPFTMKPNEAIPSAVIHVPSRLTIDTRTAVADRKLKSRNIQDSPYLGFRSQDITEEYGGYIQEMTADDKTIFYKTTAPACVAIQTR